MLRSQALELFGSVAGSNGDFAFRGDLAFVTRTDDWDKSTPEDGFNVVDIADPSNPTVLARFECIGSFVDISVWDDIVVLSQDRVTAGDDCAAKASSESAADAFAGIRIVSIADPARPTLLASVPTGISEGAGLRSVRGSHTNTIVPDLEHRDASGSPAPRVLVYASMFYYPGAKPHASIVEIPLGDPSAARIVGTFDNGTGMTCHDITVYLPAKLAACAAYTAGVILFDISDPVRPVIVSHLVVPGITQNIESHHSTTFSNDGRSLVINAEILQTACAGGTDGDEGALWFYDITDPAQPHERSFFQLPRPNPGHSCYAHQSNVVPMRGDRDVLVTGWMGGGVNLVDFTDLAQPRELAHWVAADADGQHSFTDTAYWYNGHVYAANLAISSGDTPATQLGFEVFAVDDGLVEDTVTLPHLNPQTQEALP
ncbi:MAG TPA: hypothetical protein VMQ65_11475 [Candidatus Limnocylindria bacterium]|nr:hypothetical protein [Candidatus Limnocylindria bacterium]